jgi:uncharacterized protein (DUF2252 family)
MLRYGSSPFAFYRGAALVMAADLATTPHSGLRVQLCGDAHLSNFGFYASPERHLVFDLNDFDETLPGPFEWDVKRLAASVEIAVLSQSFKTKETRAIVVGAGRSYRENMRAFAMMPNQAVWYARLDADEFLAKLREVASPERLRKAETLIASARSWPGGVRTSRTRTSRRATRPIHEYSSASLTKVSPPTRIRVVPGVRGTTRGDPDNRSVRRGSGVDGAVNHTERRLPPTVTHT